MAILSSRNGILILTLITAGIHLMLGITQSDPLFVLNGAGYLVLLYAYLWTPGFLKSQRSLIRWAYIGFAVVTIVMFFAMSPDPFTSVLGLITKFDELLLVVALLQSKA